MATDAGYDAFLSYSRQHDGWLAPGLQAGLERFAKPWYRTRALRVFRDTASLAADPALWGSIEAALRDSRWFVLLASPDAAHSAWVDREVAWWLANRSADRLLIVATAPGLRWDPVSGDWAQDAPVPPSLRGVLRSEPLWVDLSGLEPGGARRGLARARVPAGQLASIAAPLRGVARDALIGEHLRQHRRTMRIARGAAAVLAVLTALSVALSVLAVGQRRSALAQARIATSRQLAAEAAALLGTRLGVALQLAVAGYQTDDNKQTRAALLAATAASPQLVRYLNVGATITALAASADGKVLVAGTSDGRLVRFDLARGERAEVHASAKAVTGLSVSANGDVAAATDGFAAVTWSVPAPRVVRIDRAASPGGVAVSPSGALVAVVDKRHGTVLVSAASGGGQRRSPPIADTDHAGFPSDSQLALVSDSGTWERVDPRTFRVLAISSSVMTAVNSYTAGVSANAAYFGYQKYDSVWVAPTGREPSSGGGSGYVPDAPAAAVALSPDGTSAAAAQSGTITVAAIQPGISQYTPPQELTGNADTTSVVFLGDSGLLASAADGTIALWNTGQVSRLGQPAGVTFSAASTASGPPSLLPSPYGSWMSVTDQSGTPGAWVIGTGQRPVTIHGWALPVGGAPAPLFLVAAGVTQGTVLETASGRDVADWPEAGTGPANVAAAAMLPGGQQLAVVGMDGSVYRCDLASGTVRQVSRGSGSPSLDAASVRPDGGAVILTGPDQARYVDTRTGATHTVGDGGVVTARFASGYLLVERGTGTLEIWDRDGRTRLRTLPGVGGVATALAVTPDGTLVARLADDGTVTLTSLDTGSVLATLTLPNPHNSGDPWYQTAIAFTSDDRYLYTATTGGQLLRWTLDPADLIRSACAISGRSLTPALWRQYTGTPPPARLPCT